MEKKMEELKAKKIEDYSLDIGFADRSMWLMKCSSLVDSSFQSRPFVDDPYPKLAKVVLSINPISPEQEETQFAMELDRVESANMPKLYTLDMSKDLIPMEAFSWTSQGKNAAEGKIKNRFDMRPHNENIEGYGKLCRERTSKYMCKSRQIQVIDNANGMHMRPMPGMIIPITANPDKKKMTNKTPEMKRTRRDQREMEEVMFNLFERQSNWTLRQLIQETDQPEQFMKDLLRDLCIYNNKGSNQGTYELKPEYKKTTQG